MQTPNVPPDALVKRFAADLIAISQASRNDKIGVAISGGPDSVALLLLAAAAFPGRIAAATVNHRLRRAASAEAGFVADLCRSLGVPHGILTLDRLPRGNVSAVARSARYAALDAWATTLGIAWIATGHHAEDQLETMIMRLNRGSGVAGLAGVRARHGRVIRPLLSWRRNSLAEIVTAAGIVAVDDPSNRDDRYDRARLRKVLAETEWLDPVAAAHSARALADAEDSILWSVAQLEKLHVVERDGFVSFDRHRADFPGEYLRRIVRDCLARVDPRCVPREEALGRVLAALEKKGVATVGRVICRGGDTWLFHGAPPRRPTG